MKKLFVSVAVAFLFSGCHTLPYATMGAFEGAKEGWEKHENINPVGKFFISTGGCIGGLVMGGANGAGNDLKFFRSQKFDYSEIWNPFNISEPEKEPAEPAESQAVQVSRTSLESSVETVE